MAIYLVVDILTIKCAPFVHVDIHLMYRLYGIYYNTGFIMVIIVFIMVCS